MQKHIMLDLETMGVSNNAAIISIGAVAFTEDEVLGTYYVTVDLQSSMDAGGEIDASTVIWWLKQSEAARQEFDDRGNLSVKDALLLFADFFKQHDEGTCILWGNGATFDNVILSSAYKRLKLDTPWGHRNSLCYRTMRRMHADILPDETNGTHHNALCDAEYQALHLMKILKHINLTKKE